MRSSRRRASAAFIALAMLLSIAASPADALTLQRRWWTKVGTNGSSGAVTLKAYTDKSGSITYSLKALRRSAVYSVQIRYGTCSNLGSLAIQLPSLTTSTLGTVSRTRTLNSGQMYWVWQAARRSAFVIRFVSGTSIRCGQFTFNRATRVAVPGYGIDLPVVRGPNGYPYCNVAMYLARVSQPREPGITFLYAHARRGMFLPLLTQWRYNHGANLIGKTVKVWTSDSYVVSYRITKVRVTTNVMSGVTSLRYERLWLQTSTGPNTTYPKLVVEAARVSTVKTTYAASHPTPHIVRC